MKLPQNQHVVRIAHLSFKCCCITLPSWELGLSVNRSCLYGWKGLGKIQVYWVLSTYFSSFQYIQKAKSSSISPTSPNKKVLLVRIPWTEEPGGLQSMGSQRVRHNWATNTFTFLFLAVLHTWFPGRLSSYKTAKNARWNHLNVL